MIFLHFSAALHNSFSLMKKKVFNSSSVLLLLSKEKWNEEWNEKWEMSRLLTFFHCASMEWELSEGTAWNLNFMRFLSTRTSFPDVARAHTALCPVPKKRNGKFIIRIGESDKVDRNSHLHVPRRLRNEQVIDVKKERARNLLPFPKGRRPNRMNFPLNWIRRREVD